MNKSKTESEPHRKQIVSRQKVLPNRGSPPDEVIDLEIYSVSDSSEDEALDFINLETQQKGMTYKNERYSTSDSPNNIGGSLKTISDVEDCRKRNLPAQSTGFPTYSVSDTLDINFRKPNLNYSDICYKICKREWPADNSK